MLVQTQVVVTTEETVRGLDFPFLEFVVILEPPRTGNTYLHMAGRAGRAGRPGTVVSLVDEEEMSSITRISQNLGLSFEELQSVRKARGSKGQDDEDPTDEEAAGDGEGAHGVRDVEKAPAPTFGSQS